MHLMEYIYNMGDTLEKFNIQKMYITDYVVSDNVLTKSEWTILNYYSLKMAGIINYTFYFIICIV